jgi:CBS domain containing-hemolysin-like protein
MTCTGKLIEGQILKKGYSRIPVYEPSSPGAYM